MDEKLPDQDLRLTRVRTLEEGVGYRPPATQEQWERRARELREQILVATGLWPMPPRLELHPQVYGRLERDGYTIEKVVLRTLPGFYLAGNLYRPKTSAGRVPGVLCPHGHWHNGRFEDVVQARGAGLARLRCVAFHYDMVGRGDSKPFGHTFRDARMDRLGMSLVGLQLWNSICALDFVRSLPDVDPARIGCTGASGGGTQAFLLAAVDDRVNVSAPVCMVSTGFQGGCECENCPSLRIDTDNVEIASVAAPRPQFLVGATGDWTKEIVEKGFPEIQATYRLFGHPEKVGVARFDAGHNYNQQSREAVYGWFSRWLVENPDAPGVHEAPFTPETEETLSCYDADHARPADEVDAARVKETLVRLAAEQVEALAPRTAAQWHEARQTLTVGLRHRLAARVAAATELVVEPGSEGRLFLGRRGRGDRIPALLLLSNGARAASATLVVTPDGLRGTTGGRVAALIRQLREGGHSVCVIEVLGAGEHGPAPAAVERFYNTYNRTLIAEQVQDVLTALVFLRSQPGVRSVSMVGDGSLGPVCLLARAVDTHEVRTAVDADAFEYSLDRDAGEPRFGAAGDSGGGRAPGAERALPGILRFGGLRMAAALAAPAPLLLHHTGGALDPTWARRAYELHGRPEALRVSASRLAPESLAKWLSEEKHSDG